MQNNSLFIIFLKTDKQFNDQTEILDWLMPVLAQGSKGGIMEIVPACLKS